MERPKRAGTGDNDLSSKPHPFAPLLQVSTG